MSETTLIVNYSCLTCLQITSPPTAAAAAFAKSPLSPANKMACFASLRRNKKEDKEIKDEKMKESVKSQDGTDFAQPYTKPESDGPRHEPNRNAVAPKGILKKNKPKEKPKQDKPYVPRSVARREERIRKRAETTPAQLPQLFGETDINFEPALSQTQRAALDIIQKSHRENLLREEAADKERKRQETRKQDQSSLRNSIPESVAEVEEDEMNGIRDKGRLKPSSLQKRPTHPRGKLPQGKGENSIYSKPWPPVAANAESQVH
ncbi:hypothetical protein AAP_05438 [Ascosphaera apis ARSEF 7405]|uniref:Uncharacterized protein n=1 Tax=Ascosphaera apis ARSEF 7405 TaxID=392613 RepID=A0A167VM92_9EURO|nr:hypothetical protein AAP_05438 [Ascosphaera apis ARSEF 7405]